MNLETQVKNYDEAYRYGVSVISDKQFAQLETNRLRLDPNCYYFNKKKIGYGFSKFQSLVSYEYLR